MRAVTTLAQCVSDGYALFPDPYPLLIADHLHDRYPFWDVDPGMPKDTGEPFQQRA